MAKKRSKSTGVTITLNSATYYSFQDDVIRPLPREARLMMLEFGLAVTMDGSGTTHTWFSEGIPGSAKETGIEALWELICAADTLVGYNIRAFDLPLLYFEAVLHVGHRTGWPTAQTIDLADAVRSASGRDYALHDIAQATLGRGKTTSVQFSAELLRKGETQKVAENCSLDVALMRDLYLHTLAGQPLILPQRETLQETTGFRLWLDEQGIWTRLEPTRQRAVGEQYVI